MFVFFGPKRFWLSIRKELVFKKSSSTTVKRLIESSIEEIKAVVMVKYESDYRDKGKKKHFISLDSRDNDARFKQKNFKSEKNIVEIFVDEIKPVVREKVFGQGIGPVEIEQFWMFGLSGFWGTE